MALTQLYGDCREMLKTLPDASVQCIVTSPPYWRLRKYTDDPAEIGQEHTPAEYVAALGAVFAECWRVLRTDGTLWLNLGDAYANDGKWGGTSGGKLAKGLHGKEGPGRRKVRTGLPPKSLIGLPWRVAFALQDAGWILRAEIIWHKPNAMPAPVEDRPVRDHETVFLFSKSQHYYYDHLAITEPATDYTPRTKGRAAKVGGRNDDFAYPVGSVGTVAPGLRNARTVWSILVDPLADEHFAPMPQALAERCIKAGTRRGDVVLDPFAGSGTTGRAAIALGRDAVLIDLAYADLQDKRTDGVQITLNMEAA